MDSPTFSLHSVSHLSAVCAVDDMGSRIDALEKSIGDLMTQAGIEEESEKRATAAAAAAASSGGSA